jgi:hypothetical protein
MDAAYDDQVYFDDRTIDSHIQRLRKKFTRVDDSFDKIETLYGWVTGLRNRGFSIPQESSFLRRSRRIISGGGQRLGQGRHKMVNDLRAATLQWRYSPDHDACGGFLLTRAGGCRITVFCVSRAIWPPRVHDGLLLGRCRISHSVVSRHKLQSTIVLVAHQQSQWAGAANTCVVVIP